MSATKAEALARLDQDIHGKQANGRKKLCGAWTLRATAEVGPETRYVRMNCGCWDCAYCGPRKAKLYKKTICERARQHELSKFLTLTLDPAALCSMYARKVARRSRPGAVDRYARLVTFTFRAHAARSANGCGCPLCSKIQATALPYIRKCWAKWRVYLKRHAGTAVDFICITEWQKKTRLPHLHAVVNCYLPVKWIQTTWVACGGGQHVHIQAVDAHRISHYLSKYLTKELILSAPTGTRRISTARAVKLLGKKCNEPAAWTWDLLKKKIDVFYRTLQGVAQRITYDAEEILQEFSIFLDVPITNLAQMCA